MHVPSLRLARSWGSLTPMENLINKRLVRGERAEEMLTALVMGLPYSTLPPCVLSLWLSV